MEIGRQPTSQLMQAIKQHPGCGLLHNLKSALACQMKFNFFAFFELKRIPNSSGNPV